MKKSHCHPSEGSGLSRYRIQQHSKVVKPQVVDLGVRAFQLKGHIIDKMDIIIF